MEIESRQQYIRRQLVVRDKHIEYLEQELVKMDRQYTDLQICLQNQRQEAIEYKKNHLGRIQEQVHKYKQKYQFLYLKYSQINEDNKQLQKKNKQINKRLACSEKKIKLLEGQNSKLQRKCDQYHNIQSYLKQENEGFWSKITEIQKQFVRLFRENQELRALLSQQAGRLETDYQQLRTVFNERDQLIETQINNNDQTFNLYQQKRTMNPQNIKTISYHSRQDNPWKQDLNKLKNCLEYGPQYICHTFQSANLDMLASRQLFQYLRKLILHQQTLVQKLGNCQQQKQQELKAMKQKMDEILEYLSEIERDKCDKILLDTITQTEPIDFERNLSIIHENNNRLKLRNLGYFGALQKVVMYTAGVHSMLTHAHQKIEYYKKFENIYFNQQNKHKGASSECRKNKNMKKLKVVLRSILFIKIIEKQALNRRKFITKPNHIPLNKSFYEFMKNHSKNIENIELNKIKDQEETLINQQKFQFELIHDAIEYCVNKIKGPGIDMDKNMGGFLWKISTIDKS